MSVVRLPVHHWAHCTNPECTGCHLCHGGLAVCTVCGGMEGSLPSECPGASMPGDVQDAVYAGELDYTSREGWYRTEPRVWPGRR